jgi:folate-binding protein YgfZ
MKQRVLLRGAAGIDLLHRISTADIKALISKNKGTGLLLNPAGRIECWFEITFLHPDEAELTYVGDLPAQLDRFTFSERYELIPLPAPDPSGERPPESRIESLLPEPGSEFFPDGKTNPLEVNLRDAIAEQKGCYPGQEVIEKIISLGSPARKLCRIRSEGPLPKAPFTLRDADGNEAGTLTTSAGSTGLAIIKRTHLKEGSGLFAGEASVRVEKVSP